MAVVKQPIKREHITGLRFNIIGLEGATTVYVKKNVRWSGVNSCTLWALRKGADRIDVCVVRKRDRK